MQLWTNGNAWYRSRDLWVGVDARLSQAVLECMIIARDELWVVWGILKHCDCDLKAVVTRIYLYRWSSYFILVTTYTIFVLLLIN